MSRVGCCCGWWPHSGEFSRSDFRRFTSEIAGLITPITWNIFFIIWKKEWKFLYIFWAQLTTLSARHRSISKHQKQQVYSILIFPTHFFCIKKILSVAIIIVKWVAARVSNATLGKKFWSPSLWTNKDWNINSFYIQWVRKKRAEGEEEIEFHRKVRARRYSS